MLCVCIERTNRTTNEQQRTTDNERRTTNDERTELPNEPKRRTNRNESERIETIGRVGRVCVSAPPVEFGYN